MKAQTFCDGGIQMNAKEAAHIFSKADVKARQKKGSDYLDAFKDVRAFLNAYQHKHPAAICTLFGGPALSARATLP